MARENTVEMPVVYAARAAGFFERKVKWVGRIGAPDRVFSREDRGTVWIEFKKPGTDEARVMQEREHDRMRAAGMEVHLVSTVAEGKRILGIT
jgi:hypothetical protein